ncbi:PadR family transcriptional regulator [Catenulispora rubra]|uniref:PadR family transcriptional regulator n=1 Tax=Catenulispora rubra TaxID=280293 RepID=UPI0018921B91|nr:PadR family transcriptional regulator [Catenulispora rubra]
MNSSGSRTEQTFQILTALVDGPLHGYGIIQEVAQLSGGRTQLKVGTLYGALDRLSGEGLLVLDREETVNGRLRRYYRLTDAAAQVLAEDAERMAAQASVALARLRARGTGMGVARGATSEGMA